jgi:HEAT repeat protein
MNDLKFDTPQDWIDHFNSRDSKRIVEAARQVAARKVVMAVPQMLELLNKTSDPAVRNALALSLSDLKDASVFDVIVKLLNRKRTRGNRGTLLYALEGYDCTTILPLLVDIVIDGNFEESRQALSLIAGIETELDERTWQRCIERLRAAFAVTTEERRPLLNELILMFDQGE